LKKPKIPKGRVDGDTSTQKPPPTPTIEPDPQLARSLPQIRNPEAFKKALNLTDEQFERIREHLGLVRARKAPLLPRLHEHYVRSLLEFALQLVEKEKAKRRAKRKRAPKPSCDKGPSDSPANASDPSAD
jgi:hypothetical protein